MRYNIDKTFASKVSSLKMGQKVAKSALKSLKKHAKSRFFDVYPSLCSHICRSELQPQNLNRRGYYSETPYQSQRNGISMTTKRRFNHSETLSLIA